MLWVHISRNRESLLPYLWLLAMQLACGRATYRRVLPVHRTVSGVDLSKERTGVAHGIAATRSAFRLRSYLCCAAWQCLVFCVSPWSPLANFRRQFRVPDSITMQ